MLPGSPISAYRFVGPGRGRAALGSLHGGLSYRSTAQTRRCVEMHSSQLKIGGPLRAGTARRYSHRGSPLRTPQPSSTSMVPAPSSASTLSGSSSSARSKKPRAFATVSPVHGQGGDSPGQGSGCRAEPSPRMGHALRPSRFDSDELRLKLICEPGHDLVLHLEQVGDRLVEALGPQMRAPSSSLLPASRGNRPHPRSPHTPVGRPSLTKACAEGPLGLVGRRARLSSSR